MSHFETMTAQNTMTRMRRSAGLLAWVMAFVLLVPALIGLLPSPVSAAERSLWQEMQASICMEGMPAGESGKAATMNDGCCVLCVAPAVAAPAGTLDPLAATGLRPEPQLIDAVIAPDVSRAAMAAVISPVTGRGPPA